MDTRIKLIVTHPLTHLTFTTFSTISQPQFWKEAGDEGAVRFHLNKPTHPPHDTTNHVLPHRLGSFLIIFDLRFG